MHDPKFCSLCGARAARTAVKMFLESEKKSRLTMGEDEARRRAGEEELRRLKGRIAELEAELGGHDDVTDRRTKDEIVMDRAEERAKRESARRPPRRGDNSREAIAVFRANLRG